MQRDLLEQMFHTYLGSYTYQKKIPMHMTLSQELFYTSLGFYTYQEHYQMPKNVFQQLFVTSLLPYTDQELILMSRVLSLRLFWTSWILYQSRTLNNACGSKNPLIQFLGHTMKDISGQCNNYSSQAFKKFTHTYFLQPPAGNTFCDP